MKKIFLILLLALFACIHSNKNKETKIFMFNNEIGCAILNETDNYSRVVTYEIISNPDHLKMIADTLKVKNEIVYFHIPELLQENYEYASKTGNLISIYKNFDKKELLKKQFREIQKLKTNEIHLSDKELAQKAFIISHNFVKSNLKSPKSANFPFNDYRYSISENNTIIIESYVDAKNSYNAEIRTNYRIELKFNGGDWADINNWQTLNLEFN